VCVCVCVLVFVLTREERKKLTFVRVFFIF